MEGRSIIIYIILAIITTNVIRILPMTLIRKRITNTFLRSFLYYVPYVTLAVMTFPAIANATLLPEAGLAALVIGAIVAWAGGGLFSVASVCCLVVLTIEWTFG